MGRREGGTASRSFGERNERMESGRKAGHKQHLCKAYTPWRKDKVQEAACRPASDAMSAPAPFKYID